MTAINYPDKSIFVRGLQTLDFRRIAERGFGDPHNAYPHSMAWFKDHLYVGTTRACLAHRGRRRNEIDPSLLGAIWPVRIPEGLFDIDLSAEIWRYDPRSGLWDHVFTSPQVIGTHGEETPLCICLRAMVVFQGKSDPEPALYVPTMGSRYVPEAVMLRCSDGVSFEIVSEPGMGFPKPYRPRGVRATKAYKSKLFTSPAVGQLVEESNVAGFMVIGVTDDPTTSHWDMACEPHFGDRNNLTVGEIADFNDFLYAGTLNVNEGFQVWKTDLCGDPPYTWSKVLSHGAWRGQLNQVVASMCEFNGSLYIGSAIQEGGYDSSNNIGPASVEILRINADDSWDLLVGEPRQTPDGLKVPLSGIGPGFGKPCAGYIWSFCVHEGWLYAGTLDWFVHLQFSDRSRWSRDMQISAPKEMLEYLMHQYGGFDLWRTRNGNDWTPVTQNGFNTPFNYRVRTMVSSPYGLFVGATNPYGPEVAVERQSGWQYEENQRGGLEIWFGSRSKHRDELDGKCADKSTNQQTLLGRATPGAAHDASDRASLVYGQRHWRQPGFWRRGVIDIDSAREELAVEVLAQAGERAGSVVDINCGYGDSTAFLKKHFPPDQIAGICLKPDELDHCIAELPGLHFQLVHGNKLPLPDKSFGLATWVRCFDHAPTTSTLLREACRVLAPGGMLVCFDMLSNTSTGLLGRLLGRSPLASEELYNETLTKAGFTDIVIRDVTEQTLDSFRLYRVKKMEEQRLLGQLDATDIKRMNAIFLEEESHIGRCVLLSARKQSAS